MHSALEEFSRTYGQKLASALGMGQQQPSALAPQAAPQAPPQAAPPAADPTMGAPQDPGSALAPPDMGGGTDGSDAMQPAQPPQDSALEPKKSGVTFRDTFKKAPAEVQNQQLTKLEQTLKQGNQTIDSAYDDMVKQLGAPPDKNRKLDRKEKGMLLMEFGLSMLANSRKGLATAAGTAGAETMQSYQGMKELPAQQYQQSRSLIEAARTKDKATLGRESALESMKPAPGQASKLPGKFTGDDGYVYFYDENGKARKATDEAGKPIKAQPGSEGGGAHPFESDAKYNRYMEIYGHDPETGKPLSGLALEQAKQDALEFSTDKSNKLDDLDLDIRAESSADDFIRSNNDLYRDQTPEQVNEARNKIADERRRRLHRPTRSRLQTHPGNGEPSRGRRTGKKFATEADAKAAFARKEIGVGDIITVNGVEGPVE